MPLFRRKREPETVTPYDLIAIHHAELLAAAGRISHLSMPNPLARVALEQAIYRDLIIGLYRHGVDHEWAIELNHFGPHPVCPPDHDPRLSFEDWQRVYASILDWPWPQSNGYDGPEGDAA